MSTMSSASHRSTMSSASHRGYSGRGKGRRGEATTSSTKGGGDSSIGSHAGSSITSLFSFDSTQREEETNYSNKYRSSNHSSSNNSNSDRSNNSNSDSEGSNHRSYLLRRRNNNRNNKNNKYHYKNNDRESSRRTDNLLTEMDSVSEYGNHDPTPQDLYAIGAVFDHLYRGGSPLTCVSVFRKERTYPQPSTIGALLPASTADVLSCYLCTRDESMLNEHAGEDDISYYYNNNNEDNIRDTNTATRSITNYSHQETEEEEEEGDTDDDGYESITDLDTLEQDLYTVEEHLDTDTDTDTGNETQSVQTFQTYLTDEREAEGSAPAPPPPLLEDERGAAAAERIYQAVLDSRTGNTYYYHTKTRETTWTPPQGYHQKRDEILDAVGSSGSVDWFDPRNSSETLLQQPPEPPPPPPSQQEQYS
mmetsp:Transcript_3904/g.4371  ORF Transcript_3904/g.4371 Transcript_3904/m.4371 type:complete len:420 (+) Transcript_3904:1152-2411(+)